MDIPFGRSFIRTPAGQAWRETASGSWAAGSGAIFDLASNALRPEGWTSADAAGLPILPGLIRDDEWYVSGMSDPRFDDDVLHELDRFTGADLEVVDTTGLVNGP